MGTKHPVVVTSEAAMQELRSRRVSNNHVEDELFKSHKPLSKSEIVESSVKNAGKFENNENGKTPQALPRERERPKSHFSYSQADVSKRIITISALSRNEKIEDLTKLKGKHTNQGKAPKTLI